MGLCSECSEITAGGEPDSTPKEAHPATIPGKTPGLPRSRTGGMGDSFAVVLVRCQDSTNAGVGVVPELTNAARPFCLAAVLTRPARRAAVFVGPACRAGHRGLPRAVRRGSQQNALNSSVNHTHSGVRYVLPCELGSASPNVHSGRMDLLKMQPLPVGPACRAAVLVRPACRAGHRGLPRPVRRGPLQNALNSSVNHTRFGVRWVFPCKLGSASPNVSIRAECTYLKHGYGKYVLPAEPSVAEFRPSELYSYRVDKPFGPRKFSRRRLVSYVHCVLSNLDFGITGRYIAFRRRSGETTQASRSVGSRCPPPP